MLKSLVLAIGLSGALTFAASAQISGQRGPIQIEADQLDFIDSEARAVYVGNVDAVQGDARIRAEQLTIYFEQRSEDGSSATALGGNVGDVQRLVAEGEVFYLTPTERARGDRGVYDYSTDTITLTGNVTVTRGENVIAGDTLVVDVANGISRVSSESRARGERVRTVIITDGQSDE
ncbi:MAG: lipopolysaccharide transport periplasmic protein LptA [Hyphomonadaceae bacterium TMED5]|nr:MAG: lipopolysaccharide transport periplasmic protein LptA [Hyphomonadaceae bacterium TMED5]|tara:strand:- start:11372 stop:11902 length:531 start_codon:yes stop_codon:yes gene_type:complete